MYSYQRIPRLTLDFLLGVCGLYVRHYRLVYHSIGLAATGYLRGQGIPCSLYTDDRLLFGVCGLYVRHYRLVYHSIGLAATGYLRGQGIPCSLYTDDRLNDELLSPNGAWSVLPRDRSREYRIDAAKSALFVVLSVLVQLGYTIDIKKSVLWPSTAVEYLGFIILSFSVKI